MSAPAAILDVDGTLVDTNYHHAIAWHRAFTRHDIVLPVALDKAGTEHGVMVGDTTWDVEAAKRVGIETLAVMTGGFSAAELRDAGAVEVYRSVDELREALDETALA